MSYEVQVDDAVRGLADDAFGVVAVDLEAVHADAELLVGGADLPDRLAYVAQREAPLVSGGELAVLVRRIELQAADRNCRPSGTGDADPLLESVGVADLDPEGVAVDGRHQAAVKPFVHRRHYMKSAMSLG